MWGGGGAVAIELLDWTAAIKQSQGWPWKQASEPGLGPFVFVTVVRLVLALFVTAGLAVGGQLTSIAPAIGAGVAAPVILEKLGRTAQSLAK